MQICCATTQPCFVRNFLVLLLCLPNASGLMGGNVLKQAILRLPVTITTFGPQKARRCLDCDPLILVRFIPADRAIEHQDQEPNQTEEEEAEDDDFESQMHSQEDYDQESLLQLYARDRDWLKKATDVVLDPNHYPLGHLAMEDVDKITVLMGSWVRQRSVNAARSVENLLKRVVDDMRANNKQVHVNAKMYALAMDAWTKSGADGSAERAQNIHDAMVQFYEQTGDLTMRPTTATYNIIINAHGKANGKQHGSGGLEQAERVLREMIMSGDNSTKPDRITFNTLLDSYAKSHDKVKASTRAPELLQWMEKLGVEPDSYTFTSVQGIYAQSDLPNAPQQTMEILQTMLSLYEDGSLLSKPSRVNYNAVLGALSRTYSRTSAEMAFSIIEKMEDKGGYDVEPDRMSYALAILACVRCPADYGVYKAEELLLKMEQRAKDDEKKRRQVSSAAPPSVVLDLECFNVVMTSLSKRRLPDSVERIIAILGRMKQYSEDGHIHIAPTIRSWNALLNALARSLYPKAGERAEQVLRHLLDSGDQKVKPNAFSFTAVLSAFQKSPDPNDAHRADALLREMERLYYEAGELDSPPDVFHYTIVCNAWVKSGLPRATSRVMQIIGHMNDLAKQVNPAAKPNARTYHSLLDCMAKNRPEGEVERMLDQLMVLEQQGEECLDDFCFSSVIETFCRSKAKGSGRRAEAVLEKMLDHGQVKPKCKASVRSFTKIISYYRQSSARDAPYRAEYILNRMIALFKDGHPELEPDAFAFGVVMDAYSAVRHPDAGATAERLLKQMKDLHSKEGAKNLVIDASVIYNVLFAWSISSDDDAARRAELHLDNMERKFEAGDLRLKPDIRSYGLVLNAWSKSNCFDKARRALDVLKRMEIQVQKGNKDVRPNEHCFSLAINACAFTNSGRDAEVEAFEIATSLFDRMLDSDDCQPSSLTYGWFLQACGRLDVSQRRKEEQIERAWNLCCMQGLVNAFVLHRFTGASPDPLYKKLMQPVWTKHQCAYETKALLKFKISPSDLPELWTRNAKRESDRSRTDWWNSK